MVACPSRDWRTSPLTLTTSGEFMYLTSTEPGQNVSFERINDRISSVAHVDAEFGSVIY
jgi:hypothetical protein